MGDISCSWGSCDTTEGLLWEAVTCGERYNTITLSVMCSVIQFSASQSTNLY